MGPRLMLTRREDWPERLNEVIDQRRATPFTWGLQDCASFAAACVLAMTDTAPLEGLPLWSSPEAAAAVLAEEGGLVAAVTRRFLPVPVASARRGDLVMVEVGSVTALGVCLGHFAAAPGPAGLEYPAMRAARAAWRVGA